MAAWLSLGLPLAVLQEVQVSLTEYRLRPKKQTAGAASGHARDVGRESSLVTASG